ncbi:efflux RND transporter periplasmic adaptor subunit [Ideonella sp. A 288]|uniref:efflux RND transporter periplasmic adaptor subunit n=1 Tax=Ideonella sp. A 288 TaxID=1962181 RepID=UPI000B4B757F|nr:efflux RND transporter periplasmic adaptor subunit [Ideonella sp. A 288]
MKTSHTAALAVLLAAALGGAWWLQNRTNAATVLAGAAPAASGATAGGPGASASGGARGGPTGPGAPAGPIAVEVGRVEVMRLEDDAAAVGSLRANQGVMLRPEVSGRISALEFSDGQRVRRGQVLVRLDDTLQQAQLKQAEAQASIARTNLQRSRELVAQNFVSQSAVDQNAAAMDVAMAQVALAQAQLARMRILAPFDGLTGIRNVSLGDYVKDGADLVAVEDTSSVWVDFRLPERYLSRVRQGQPVQLSLDSMPGRRFEARIGALDAQLDANGRSVLVRARMANTDGTLRGGMFARARVVFAVREQALVVPEEALVPLGDKQFVIKVVDTPEGGKAAKRIEARIGHRLPGKVELLDGVAAGDLVVIAGQARLMRGEGQALRIVDIDKPAGTRPPGAGASGAASGPGNGPGARRAATAV